MSEIGVFWESELGFDEGFEIKLFWDLNKAKLRVFKGDKSKFKVVATILKTLVCNNLYPTLVFFAIQFCDFENLAQKFPKKPKIRQITLYKNSKTFSIFLEKKRSVEGSQYYKEYCNGKL